MSFRQVLGGCVLVICFVGCTGLRDSGTPTYLLPKLDANGKTVLQETTLTTIDSPYRAEGSAARVYIDPNAAASSMTGRVAEPHLAKSGNVFIPLDADSGLALSA